MSIGRLVDTVAIWLVAGLVLAIAGSSLRSVATAGGTIAVASRIDRDAPAADDGIGPSLAFVSDQARKSCEDRADQAALKVAMRDLSRRNQAIDYDAWQASADRAGRLLRKLVACSPADGRLWTQLALVDRVQVVPQADIAAHIRFSEATNPVEITTVRQRLELWRTAPAALRGLLGDVAERDTDRVLRWAYLGDVKAIVASMGRSLPSANAATVAALPAARRKAIARMEADRDAIVQQGGSRLYELPDRPPTTGP